MPRIELLRSAPFRLATAFGVALTGCTIIIFAFIYWQIVRLERERIGAYLALEAVQAAQEPIGQLLAELQFRQAADLHHVSYSALYDRDNKRLIGNITAVPTDLPVDCKPHRLDHPPQVDQSGPTTLLPVMLVACRRADGGMVVLGRELDEVVALRGVMRHALLLGLVPTVILALLVGAFLSSRALRRVRMLQQTIGRIMRGNLHERLQTYGRRDDLDRLSERINQMLDEIEHLLSEVRSIGDNIAHDLRTPLSVVRVKLERATIATDLKTASDMSRGALADLDKAFSIITALLRITEIENQSQADGMSEVNLAELAAEIFDLYEPLAEAKGIHMTASCDMAIEIRGDRHLLLEAVANLVDNAIKFTPPGGHVCIAALREGQTPLIRVSDTGPGIDETERNDVTKRFYRSDKSRHVPGHGLGLSIVVAIAKRHEFQLRMSDNKPGMIFDLVCQAPYG